MCEDMKIINLDKSIIFDSWRGEKPDLDYKILLGYAGVDIKENALQDIDILDMLYAYVKRAMEESCGQCFPCRNGLKKIAKRLKYMIEGKKSENDCEFLLSSSASIMKSARCDIGKRSLQALKDIIENVPSLLLSSDNAKTKSQNRMSEEKGESHYSSLITAPCINACPAHVDIPQYIEMIRTKREEEGLLSVENNCIMPGTIGRVCMRPCQDACVRKRNGEEISIRNLKRYLFDEDIKKQEKEDLYKNQIIEIEQRKENCENKEFIGKHQKDNKIAIIGAGPAGLSCAYFLAKNGYSPTIFEKEAKGGGMARYGIPDYRLPQEVIDKEINKIESIGVEIVYNTEIGKDKKIKDLKKENYKALCLAAGSHQAPRLHCEGEEDCLCGLVSGIEYLHQSAQGKKCIEGKTVLVIGGGNVAMDCVRTALRHGFEEVNLLYRRTEEAMPADKEEIYEAKLEGVNFHFLLAPHKIVHENGVVKELICQKMQLGKADASGRRSPQAIEGEFEHFACDVIIYAIGQKTSIEGIFEGMPEENVKNVENLENDEAGKQENFNLEKLLDRGKNIQSDAITGKIESDSFPLAFFGMGDCATGPTSLIMALAGGKRAAFYCAKLLEEGSAKAHMEAKLEAALHDISIDYEDGAMPFSDFQQKINKNELEIDKRLQSFSEVELSIPSFEARAESKRCLRCYRLIMIAHD